MFSRKELLDEADELEAIVPVMESIAVALEAKEFDPSNPLFEDLSPDDIPGVVELARSVNDQNEGICHHVLDNAINRLNALNEYLEAIDDIIVSGDIAPVAVVKLNVHRQQASNGAYDIYMEGAAARDRLRDTYYRSVAGSIESALKESYQEHFYAKNTEDAFDYTIEHKHSREERFLRLAEALENYVSCALTQGIVVSSNIAGAMGNLYALRILDSKEVVVPDVVRKTVQDNYTNALANARNIVPQIPEIARNAVDLAEAIRSRPNEFTFTEVKAPIKNAKFEI
jgi:hypothetical protein